MNSTLTKPTTNATYGAFFAQTHSHTSLGLGGKARGRPVDKPVARPSNRVLSAPDRHASAHKYTASSLLLNDTALGNSRMEETVSRGTVGLPGRRYSVGAQRGPDSAPEEAK
eukprot:EG_transcript_52845